MFRLPKTSGVRARTDGACDGLMLGAVEGLALKKRQWDSFMRRTDKGTKNVAEDSWRGWKIGCCFCRLTSLLRFLEALVPAIRPTILRQRHVLVEKQLAEEAAAAAAGELTVAAAPPLQVSEKAYMYISPRSRSEVLASEMHVTWPLALP